MTVIMNKAKESKESHEQHPIVIVVLNAVATRIPVVSQVAMTSTPFIQPMTVEFRAEQSKDPLGRQLASTVKRPGSDFSCKGHRWLILVAPIDEAKMKGVLKLL